MGEKAPDGSVKMLHDYINDGVPLPLGLTTQDNYRQFTINGLDNSHPAYGFEHSLELENIGLYEDAAYKGSVGITTAQSTFMDAGGWSMQDDVGFIIDPTKETHGKNLCFPVGISPEEVIAGAFRQKVDKENREIAQKKKEIESDSRVSKVISRISVALGLVSIGLFAAEIATYSPVEPQFTRIERLATLGLVGAIASWGIFLATKVQSSIYKDKIAQARLAKDSYQAQLDAVLTYGVTFSNIEDDDDGRSGFGGEM